MRANQKLKILFIIIKQLRDTIQQEVVIVTYCLFSVQYQLLRYLSRFVEFSWLQQGLGISESSDVAHIQTMLWMGICRIGHVCIAWHCLEFNLLKKKPAWFGREIFPHHSLFSAACYFSWKPLRVKGSPLCSCSMVPIVHESPPWFLENFFRASCRLVGEVKEGSTLISSFTSFSTDIVGCACNNLYSAGTVVCACSILFRNRNTVVHHESNHFFFLPRF